MKRVFTANSSLNQSNIEISPKGVIVNSINFFPIKHDKVKIEGKYPYFLVAGIATVSYNGGNSVFPFNIRGTSQSHLKGNLSPTTVIPTESALVYPQEKIFTYKIKNSNDDIVGFTVKLKVKYSQDSFEKELIISDEDKLKMEGNITLDIKGSTFENGMSGRNTSANYRWVLYFRSYNPVDRSDDTLVYHEETYNGSWSPSERENVPITDMAVGVMQPYISEGDSSSSPVAFVNGWGSVVATLNITAKVKTFTEKVKAN